MILQHYKLSHDKVSLVNNSVLFAQETWEWNDQRKREVEVCVLIRSNMKVGGGPKMSSSIFELPLW